MEIPSPCPNDVYEARMTTAVEAATAGGIGRMVFGDLFLEDVRAYGEGRAFSAPIGVWVAAVVERDGFVFCDVVPF